MPANIQGNSKPTLADVGTYSTSSYSVVVERTTTSITIRLNYST